MPDNGGAKKFLRAPQVIAWRFDALRLEVLAVRHTCLRCRVEMTVAELYENDEPELACAIWACPTCGSSVLQECPRGGVESSGSATRRVDRLRTDPGLTVRI
jgi:hypothetical protein